MLVSYAVAKLTDDPGGLFQIDGEDLDQEFASDPLRVEMLNRGIETVCSELGLVTTRCELDLSKDKDRGGSPIGYYDIGDVEDGTVSIPIIEPWIVNIDGEKLNGPDGTPGVWTYDDFTAGRSDWRAEAAISTRPSIAVWTQEEELVLHIRPDATAELLTAYIEGKCRPRPIVFAEDMGKDLSFFGIPRRAHWGCVYAAALHSMGITASYDEVMDRMKIYSASMWKDVMSVREVNISAVSGTAEGQLYSDYMDA